MNKEDNSCVLIFELSSLDLVPYSKLCPGLNNNFMVYLLQLHINPFSEWHLAGASVCYVLTFHVNHLLSRWFTWNVKTCFLWKIKIKFLTVLCYKFAWCFKGWLRALYNIRNIIQIWSLLRDKANCFSLNYAVTIASYKVLFWIEHYWECSYFSMKTCIVGIH